MPVPRQAPSPSGGRVNQKKRTRAAIVEAAKQLLADGVTPSVAHAAEVAEVSRTTAYRYFPTQDALLVEVAMDVDVDEIEQVVAAPVDANGACDRALEVLERFNRHVAHAEAQYRTALRLYLDLWLESAAEGERAPTVREGRRRRWFEQSLAPRRTEVSDEAWDRLIVGLCLLCGPEALAVVRDVCQLDAEEAQGVVRWAAEALLEATFG